MKRLIKPLYFMFHRVMININVKNNVKIKRNCEIYPGSVIGKNVRIGKNTKFDGIIDSFSYVGDNCLLKGTSIGKYCSIASNVKVLQSTHPTFFVSTSPVFFSPLKQCGTTFVSERKFEEKLLTPNSNFACEIGNDVWIGENVTIIGGHKIGDGAIVAAGAVVTKDVEPYEIVAGVPAKVLKKRFPEEISNKLEHSKWWDWDEVTIKANATKFLDLDGFLKLIE